MQVPGVEFSSFKRFSCRRVSYKSVFSLIPPTDYSTCVHVILSFIYKILKEAFILVSSDKDSALTP